MNEPGEFDRPFLKGTTVYLRPLEPDDVNDRYLHWVNDEDVVGGRFEQRFPITRARQEAYVRSILDGHDQYLFAIVEKASGRFIGTARLGPVNWIHRFATHGMMIGEKNCWNRGYGREVIFLMLNYGFGVLNMRKFYASVQAGNPASIRKNEAVGYEVEYVEKEKYFYRGTYVDNVVMSITAARFFELHPDGVLNVVPRAQDPD